MILLTYPLLLNVCSLLYHLYHSTRSHLFSGRQSIRVPACERTFGSSCSQALLLGSGFVVTEHGLAFILIPRHL